VVVAVVGGCAGLGRGEEGVFIGGVDAGRWGLLVCWWGGRRVQESVTHVIGGGDRCLLGFW